MIHYRKILELHDEGISLRSVAASTGNSRQKVTEVISLAEKKGLVCPLEEEMTDQWLGEFLFPEKTLEGSGRHPLDFDYIHAELAKPNVTLSLLHHEYEVECRANQRIPYSYRSFLRHYSKYADKYKATLRIRRKPGEIMEAHGRFNLIGQSALYTSDILDGAASEISKEKGDERIDIIKWSLKEKINVLNMVDKDYPLLQYCQFSSTSETNVKPEYLIPNFIAQCCSLKGIAGLRFVSNSLSDAYNYVFFNFSKGWFEFEEFIPDYR